MVGRRGWEERLERDRESLALSLGLTVEELLIAQTKPYFFQLTQFVEQNGGTWKDHELAYVKQGVLMELSGVQLIMNPEAWFED